MAKESPQEIALERIKQVKKEGGTMLNLSYLGLTKIPPEVADLTQLTHLLLDNNKIEDVTLLEPLHNLKVLTLEKNQLKEIPKFFLKLDIPIFWGESLLVPNLPYLVVKAIILARALDLDLALARDRDRDIDLDLALDRDRDLALDLALALDRARDRARDQDQDRDLARDRVLARARARARARALDLARDIARARARALDLARALDPRCSPSRSPRHSPSPSPRSSPKP